MVFYLGTHEPSWLATAGVPLFVSHRRLIRRKALPKAIAPWALDSGAFSELSMFGQWQTTPEEYVTAVRRYTQEIGKLAWAAPQDRMCEIPMLRRTGALVGEDTPENIDAAVLAHQVGTVDNFCELEQLWWDATLELDTEPQPSPFRPVIQGLDLPHYLRCIALYRAAGVDLSRYPTVGVGSVCRRQATAEIGRVVQTIRAQVPGIALHGFGVKLRGLAQYGDLLESSDSMAWSFDARRTNPLPSCTHKSCANCLTYAMKWRQKAVTAAGN